MSSRALTRESGTSYLVQFFEDNEYLVVNRSRIFREGRLVTDDVANIQWGVNPKQTSEGKIIAIGDYSQMVQKLKSQKNVQDNTLNDVSENSTVAKKPRKRPAPKSSTTDKENTPAKKLKSGKPAAKIISRKQPKWLLNIQQSQSATDVTIPPAPAVTTQQSAADVTNPPAPVVPNQQSAADVINPPAPVVPNQQSTTDVVILPAASVPNQQSTTDVVIPPAASVPDQQSTTDVAIAPAAVVPNQQIAADVTNPPAAVVPNLQSTTDVVIPPAVVVQNQQLTTDVVIAPAAAIPNQQSAADVTNPPAAVVSNQQSTTDVIIAPAAADATNPPAAVVPNRLLAADVTNPTAADATNPTAAVVPNQQSAADVNILPAAVVPNRQLAADVTILPAAVVPNQQLAADVTNPTAAVVPNQQLAADVTNHTAAVVPNQRLAADVTNPTAAVVPNQQLAADVTNPPALRPLAASRQYNSDVTSLLTNQTLAPTSTMNVSDPRNSMVEPQITTTGSHQINMQPPISTQNRPIPQLPPLSTSFVNQLLADDDIENAATFSSPVPGPSTPTRPVFDFDPSFTELFRSPNVGERRFITTIDHKFNTVNKKLAQINLQLREQNEKLTYMLQLLITHINQHRCNDPQTTEGRPFTAERFPTVRDDSDTFGSSSLQQDLPESRPTSVVEQATSTAPAFLPTTPVFPAQTSDPIINVPTQFPGGVSSVTTSYTPVPRLHVASDGDEFQDIPAPHRLSTEQLFKIQAHSRSVGILATKLISRLYPELFGDDNLRKKYNYNGYRGEKMELDRQRKTYFQRYILFLHPELQDSKAFQSRVVNPVNEFLRRPNISSLDCMF